MGRFLFVLLLFLPVSCIPEKAGHNVDLADTTVPEDSQTDSNNSPEVAVDIQRGEDVDVPGDVGPEDDTGQQEVDVPVEPHCGDSNCDEDETCQTCPMDCDACPTCNLNGQCDPWENNESCQQDCPKCGDGYCDPEFEDGNSCKADCVVCDDGFCAPDLEDCKTCPEDCGECTVCGDSKCLAPENAVVCPNDCGPCGDGLCGTFELAQEYYCTLDCDTPCGDGECSAHETANLPAGDKVYCPSDCSVPGDDICSIPEALEELIDLGDCDENCGNGECEAGETSESCVADCPICGDGFCSVMNNVQENCPSDCLKPCGDGLCLGAESADECPIDCGGCFDGVCSVVEFKEGTCPADCPDFCGNEECDNGETGETCPWDCDVCLPACDLEWQCGQDINCGVDCGFCPDGYDCVDHTCCKAECSQPASCSEQCTGECGTCDPDTLTCGDEGVCADGQ